MASAKVRSGVIGAVLLFATPVAASAGQIVLAVPGIPGPYCAYGVAKRLLELDGVAKVETSWESEQIRITTRDDAHITAEDIKQAVKRADYPYSFEVRTAE